MAKGTIIEHQSEGLYRIRLSYSRDQLDAELERIEARLPAVAVDIIEAKNEISDKESGADEVVAKINALIPQYVQDRDKHRDELLRLQRSLADAQAFISKLKVDLAELQSEQVSLRKRRQLIDSVPEDKEMDAWCADYTTDLEGDVGIADINDEGGQGVVIEPGFEGAAAYNPSIHGQLMAREAMSGPQVYFNTAILPGMQKLFPRYRAGTITQIKGDTCSVKLEPAKSSAQGLDINQEESLKDVPIQYMDCNGDAFEEDDPVLVRFFNEGPQVVGFVSDPRPCNVDMVWKSLEREFRGASYDIQRRARIGEKPLEIIEYANLSRAVGLYRGEEWFEVSGGIFAAGQLVAEVPKEMEDSVNDFRVVDNAVTGRTEIWVSGFDGDGDAVIVRFTMTGQSLGKLLLEGASTASGYVFMSVSPHYYIFGTNSGVTVRSNASHGNVFSANWCGQYQMPHEQTGLVDITDELAVWACKESVNCRAVPYGYSIPVPVDYQYLAFDTVIEGFVRGIVSAQLSNTTLTVFGPARLMHFEIMRDEDGLPIGFSEIARHQFADFENYNMHASTDRGRLKSIPPP